MAFINIDTLEGNKRFVMFPTLYVKFDGQLKNGLVVHFLCYMKYDFKYDERSIIMKDMKIPKRINKHLLKEEPVT